MSKKSATPNVIKRPPIVAVMGHIDHGKSTLLDYIRKANVVEGEAGGITQHLSAYEAVHETEHGPAKITFLDTPGHEAFRAMRSRGAVVADVAILVVSAEDGVKEQTKEAYESIQSAGIPFVVAINKIDMPNANAEKIKRELGEAGIYLEGQGGDVSYAAISAKTGEGVPELLEIITLTADLQELSGDTAKPAEGIVLESEVDPKRGITATVVITDGTLKTGMHLVAGAATAPVRAITTSAGEQAKELQFSAPALIAGWSMLPSAGTPFFTYESKKEAEKAAEEHSHAEAGTQIIGSPDAELLIPVILRSDVGGTLEAIVGELEKVINEKVALKLIQKGVGDITENDIKVGASFPGTLILGFHTSPDSKATALLETVSATVKTFTVIYELVEYVDEEVKKRTPKETVEEAQGQAKVLRFFSAQKEKQVVGGTVTTGVISKKAHINIYRRGNLIGEGKILELQKQKVPVDEVSEGAEFGMMVESKIEIAEGDTLEAIMLVTR